MSQVEYAELAPLYDLINERCIDYGRQAAWVIRLLRRRGIAESLVLDVGCATGQHAARLREAGHRVVGLDLSRQLLSMACEKGRLHDVVIADMRRMCLGRHFDVVLCLNHTINYMLGADLERCFAEVAGVLKPGALFIFDFFDYGPMSEWNAIWRDAVEADGVRVEMIHWMTADDRGTVATDAHTYRVTRNGVTANHRAEDRLRITRTREVLDQVRKAGFEVVERGRKTDLDMGPEGCSVTVAATLNEGR